MINGHGNFFLFFKVFKKTLSLFAFLKKKFCIFINMETFGIFLEGGKKGVWNLNCKKVPNIVEK